VRKRCRKNRDGTVANKQKKLPMLGAINKQYDLYVFRVESVTVLIKLR
jgi:hypothetical protein